MRRVTFEQLKEIEPIIIKEYEEVTIELRNLSLLDPPAHRSAIRQKHFEYNDSCYMIKDLLKSKNKRHNFKDKRIWELVDELENKKRKEIAQKYCTELLNKNVAGIIASYLF